MSNFFNTHPRVWWAVLLVLCAGMPLSAPVASAQQAIGHVKAAAGFVQVVRDGRANPVEAGAPLYRKDELITGRDGSLGVTFRDGSRIALGPTSHLSLEGFEFEPAEKKLSFLARLAHGTMHLISGVIAKLSPESVAVETPVATIAVRGTNFAIRIPRRRP